MKKHPKPWLDLTAAAFLTVFALSTVACGGGPAEDSAAGEMADTASEVEYEPAYPEEVSDEGLSEDDTRQQEGHHAHADGDEHAHGGEGHMNDDESHMDGDDEGHMHDDEGHMHDDEGHMHDDEDPMDDEHGDHAHQS